MDRASEGNGAYLLYLDLAEELPGRATDSHLQLPIDDYLTLPYQLTYRETTCARAALCDSRCRCYPPSSHPSPLPPTYLPYTSVSLKSLSDFTKVRWLTISHGLARPSSSISRALLPIYPLHFPFLLFIPNIIPPSTHTYTHTCAHTGRISQGCHSLQIFGSQGQTK